MSDAEINERMPSPGDLFAGTYDVFEVIGQGGCSYVFRARREGSAHDLALKVLDPKMTEEPPDVFLQRFYREALLTSALRHPNTVTPIDYGRTQDGLAYIVMEYLQGESVDDVLARGESFDASQTASIIVDVLESMAEAHERSIVHSDIKASNIYLQKGHDNARVLDFGVAQLITDANMTGQIFGTPHYVAPEVALGRPPRPESDIYSLAIAAYEMLCVVPPFDADTLRDVLRMHIAAPFPDLPASVQDTALGTFIVRATSKSADSRPTAKQAIDLLKYDDESALDAFPTVFTRVKTHVKLKAQSEYDEEQLRRSLEFDNLTLRYASDDDFAFAVRQPEYARLLGWLTEFRVTGGAVLLRGALGAGKRRLVAEALSTPEMEVPPASIFALKCSQAEDGGEFELAFLFEQLASRGQGLNDEERKDCNDLAAHLRERAQWDKERRRKDGIADLQDVISRLIRATAARHPLYLVISELEYADEFLCNVIFRTLDELDRQPVRLTVLLTLSADQPLGTRTTYHLLRNIESGMWSRSRTLRLNPLDEGDLRLLLHSSHPASTEASELLVRLANGSPGRMLGLLRSGKKHGIIYQDYGQLVVRLRGDIGAMSDEIPQERDVVERVSRIIMEERFFGVLTAISYLGTRFPETAAQAMANRLVTVLGDEAAADLDRVVERNLLQRTVERDEQILSFHHYSVVCDLRERLTDDLREAFVRTAGAVLEEYGNGPEELHRAAELYADLEDFDAACDCALRAANVAEDQGDVTRSDQLYSLAYELWEATGSFAADRRVSKIELGLARVKLAQGAMGFAEQMLERVIERASNERDIELELVSHIELASLGLQRGFFDDVRQRLPRILDLAKSAPDEDSYVQALLVAGRFHRAQGNKQDAARSFIEAEKLAARGSHGLLRARARMGIALSLLLTGMADRAAHFMDEALSFLRRANEPDLLIEALVERGNVELAREDERAAEKYFREAERLAELQGRSQQLADILAGQGTALLRADMPDRATIQFLRALERYRELGHVRGEAKTLGNLARCASQRGQVSAAGSYVDQALASFKKLDDRIGRARTLLIRAEIRADANILDKALEDARDAEHMFQAMGAGRDRARALIIVGDIVRRRGDDNGAHIVWSAAKDIGRKLKDNGLLDEIEEMRSRLERSTPLER